MFKANPARRRVIIYDVTIRRDCVFRDRVSFAQMPVPLKGSFECEHQSVLGLLKVTVCNEIHYIFTCW